MAQFYVVLSDPDSVVGTSLIWAILCQSVWGSPRGGSCLGKGFGLRAPKWHLSCVCSWVLPSPDSRCLQGLLSSRGPTGLPTPLPYSRWGQKTEGLLRPRVSSLIVPLLLSSVSQNESWDQSSRWRTGLHFSMIEIAKPHCKNHNWQRTRCGHPSKPS